MYYTVIIPKIGYAYLRECEQKFVNCINNGYDMSCHNIGINRDGRNLRVIVSGSQMEIQNNIQIQSQIYEYDSFNSDKYGALDYQTAISIVIELNNRKWILWNRPPIPM